MGEDHFWAIRGGEGASFGVIFSWKVRLVQIPPSVTVFKVAKTLEQGASKLLQKWQRIGDKLPEDLFLHAATEVVNAISNNNKTIRVSFDSLYLGEAKTCSCFSTSESSELLLNRTAQFKGFFKAKSDYVKEPISETELEGLYKKLLEAETSELILTPCGGKMSEIQDSETPFPRRRGNIYKIQYMVTWDKEEETEQHLRWMRSLYSYMAPYVSKSPRAAYLNYRDLNLGWNKNGNTSFAQASVWGLKYFKNNFKISKSKD
ncbi:hypothetical protein GH714_014119 [Hevea brasiliensis]|uniref:Uncharacterized protein n=1 Tax=Hevea brasiliensis TaxID=3981 RepID=A0A6A6MBA8_HEVBR|nr:hypothetical protein GH714_014119 [Hevea brasiliensis]